MDYSTIELLYRTNHASIDDLLRGTIGLLETVFPNRIRGHFLTGSYRQATQTSGSDIDLIVVFKGEFAADEADQVRAIRRYASMISPVRLDIVPTCEAGLRQTGSVGLKRTGLLLFGDDTRDQIPLQPFDSYIRDVIQGVIGYLCELRGDQPLLQMPLAPPDPDGEFLGYERFGIFTGYDVKPGLRTLINAATLAATALVGLQSDAMCDSKSGAVAAYQRSANDEWSQLVETLYTRCKGDWHYQIPKDAADRHALQALCIQFNAFENYVLSTLRPYILVQLNSDDVSARQWAVDVLKTVDFNEV